MERSHQSESATTLNFLKIVLFGEVMGEINVWFLRNQYTVT